MTGNHVQVAVIGFGPSGALAASLLGRAGITALVIDKSREVYPKPRALAVDHEIMRLFDNLGVASKVLPYTAPFTASEYYGAQGQLIRRIDMVPEPYPMGYIPNMVFTQPPVEAVMRAHAASWPGIEIALGTELIDLVQDADGVMLDLRDDTGATRHVRADYVIACDGASSVTRKILDIALDDLVFDEPWLVVDVQVHDHALAKLPATAAQYCDPARPTTYLLGPGNHRRWEIMLLPGEDRFAMEDPAQVWKLLQRWLTPDDATLWRASSYQFHALVAHEWRRGRVFLAGDAAHQQPPFIGQGMCQGLRDVSNLIWKLERVIKGQSVDALLDSYGIERGAHVRELTGRIKAIGHVICERDPAAAAVRDARMLAEGGGAPRTITRQEIVPPLRCGVLSTQSGAGCGSLFPQPWIRRGAARVLLDAVSGVGWRVVVDGKLPDGCVAAAQDLGLTIIEIGGIGIEECDGVVARWFAGNDSHAALVRPDHYVFATASTADQLAAQLHELAETLLPACATLQSVVES